MRFSLRRTIAVAVGVAAILAACENPVAEQPGSIAYLQLRAELSGTTVDVIVVEITAADIPTPLVFNIPRTDDVASGTLELPAGSSRTITARAYDSSGIETHRGQRTVDIVAGSNQLVQITLDPLTGEQPVEAVLGTILVLVDPAVDTITVGDTTRLSAAVTNGVGDTLQDRSVQWATLNPGIAEVDTTGLVKAIAVGEAQIVAVHKNVGGSATVVVTPGSVTFSTAEPRWLFYESGAPFYQAGSGGPEGFLYLGTRQADGTRSGGDQQPIIDALAAAGVNSLYMQMVRSHGGDGTADENPWIDSDPANGLDQDILDQWEGWFSSMNAAGITPFLIFYDDSADPFGSHSTAEQNFVDAIVSEFEHHPRLIWVVAEEYSEALTQTRVSQIAGRIRALDAVHPTSVHQLGGTSFDFPSDGNIEQFAMQLKDDDPSTVHASITTAWSNAAGNYNVHMAELNNTTGHGEHTDDEVRQFNWAAAMGGAYVSVYRWWEPNAPSTTELEQLGHLRSFMESTRFDLTEPADARAFGDTEWVLAHRSDLGNDHFIGYGRSVSTGIGFTGLDAATYTLTWMDPTTGEEVGEVVTISGGDTTFPKPSVLSSSELALYARKGGG